MKISAMKNMFVISAMMLLTVTLYADTDSLVMSPSNGYRVAKVFGANGAEAAIPILDQQFVSPPREARPYTWWM